MNFLFLMDPLETVLVDKDTSFVFMLAAHGRSHQVYYLPHGGMSIAGSKMLFDVVPVVPQRDANKPFLRSKPVRLSDEQVDAVFIRSDPPFNESYLLNTWLLDALAQRVPVINSPHGLRTVNEKLWATRFTDLVPLTIVTRDRQLYRDFLAEHGRAVIKPTDAKGGEGVFIVNQGETNANVIFETLSHNRKREVIVQQYIPEAEQGDKRILLLDGEPLAAVLRLHAPGEHRNNFFAGGKPYAAEINERDLQIIATLRPHLRELGLHFAGIDVIGDYLIEVNVTSPTCVQEADRLYDERYEDRVIEYVEQLVARGHAHA